MGSLRPGLSYLGPLGLTREHDWSLRLRTSLHTMTHRFHDLTRFLDVLRREGLALDARHDAAVHAVVMRLLAKPGADPDEATVRRHLRPILCATRRDEIDFDRRWDAFFGTAEPVTPPPPPVDVRRAWRFGFLRAAAVSVIVVIAALGAGQVFFKPKPRQDEPITARDAPVPVPEVPKSSPETGVWEIRPVAPPAPFQIWTPPADAPASPWMIRLWSALNPAERIVAIAALLVIALSLLGLVLASAARARVRHLARGLVHAGDNVRLEHLWIDLERDELDLGPFLHGISARLRRHESVASARLNEEATVRRTAENGGWLVPVPATRPQTPEYLVLLEENHRHDHWERLLSAWIEQLRFRGVEMDVFRYRGHPGVSSAVIGENRRAFSLRELNARFPRHRVLLTGVPGPVRDIHHETQPWVQELRLWEKARVLLTPPGAEEDLDAMAFAEEEGWRVFPFAADGLRSFAAWVAEDGMPSLRPEESDPALPPLLAGNLEAWMDTRPPAVATVRAGVRQIADWLGPFGMLWLRACAVYPQVDWNLTRFLGAGLRRLRTTEQDGDVLWKLARLPWLRAGKMPGWLRLELLRGLPREDRLAVQTLIAGALIQGAEKHDLRRTDQPVDDAAVYPLEYIVTHPGRVRRDGDRVAGRARGAVRDQVQEAVCARLLGSSTSFRLPEQVGGARVPRPGLAVVSALAVVLALGGAFWYLGDKLSLPPIAADPPALAIEKVQVAPGADNWRLRLSDGTPFLWIPAGKFMMGSPADEDGRFEEREAQVQVELTQGRWMAATEVTQGQWKSVMGNSLQEMAKDDPVYIEDPEYPMYWVDWNQAREYCAKLTERELKAGRIPNGWAFRLPTEAEWEFACRAGKSTALYSGPLKIEGDRNGRALDPIAWYGGNSGRNYPAGAPGYDTADWKEKQYPDLKAGPRRVGGKAPNAFGLHDMIGNVLEWCEDGYVDKLAGGKDPQGDSKATVRVFRGGGWDSGARGCRSASRSRLTPGNRDFSLGFRPVLSPASTTAGAEAAKDNAWRMAGKFKDREFHLYDVGVHGYLEEDKGFQLLVVKDYDYVILTALDVAVEVDSSQQTDELVKTAPDLEDIELFVYSAEGQLIVGDNRAGSSGMAGVQFRAEYTGSVDVYLRLYVDQPKHKGPRPVAYFALVGIRGNSSLPPVEPPAVKPLSPASKKPAEPVPASRAGDEGGTTGAAEQRVSGPGDRDFRNGLGLEMVWIQPGTFLMGSPPEEADRSDDETQHEVTLTNGYWIGKHELTQAAWTEVMGENPSKFTESGPNAPVEQVSWEEAMDFCRKLTEREAKSGTVPAGWEYSLPTEAQWEYACRAGTTTPFSFGSVLDGTQANCDGTNPYGTTKKGPYLEKTTPVGSYPANPWGLYDMHGNVREWCLDWYGDYPAGAASDPRGPEKATNRVFRGGGWINYAQYCRSAYRYWSSPDNRSVNLGFRPVLSPASKPAGGG